LASFAPPSVGSSSLLADWLEIAAFLAPEGKVFVNDLNSALAAEEDVEAEDILAESDRAETRLHAAIAAIDERRSFMKSSYPFSISSHGRLLCLEPWSSAGRASYLLCLLLSHAVKDGLLQDSAWPTLRAARDLFQAAATLCAAGACGGPAFSFGWPRPDKSGFHQKLLTVWEHFKDGSPYELPPPGSPPQIKDGGIDVIAWSYEPDGHPPSTYLLGQAASGKGWTDKSVRGFIPPFHDFWFEYRPSSTPNPAMFIPFCLPEPESTESDHLDQETLDRGHARYLTYLLGTIHYRYRIPRHADRAIELASRGIGPIERLDTVSEIVDWITETRESLWAEAKQ